MKLYHYSPINNLKVLKSHHKRINTKRRPTKLANIERAPNNNPMSFFTESIILDIEKLKEAGYSNYDDVTTEYIVDTKKIKEELRVDINSCTLELEYMVKHWRSPKTKKGVREYIKGRDDMLRKNNLWNMKLSQLDKNKQLQKQLGYTRQRVIETYKEIGDFREWIKKSQYASIIPHLQVTPQLGYLPIHKKTIFIKN